MPCPSSTPISPRIVRGAEARFTNFEVLTPGDEGFPSAVSGGTWARAPAAVIGDLRDFGFNLMAWANNHTLDYSLRRPRRDGARAR